MIPAFSLSIAGTDEHPTVCIAEQVKSEPAWTYLELPANYMAPVNDPQLTADALVSLV